MIDQQTIEELFIILSLQEGSDVIFAHNIIINNIDKFELNTLKRLHFKIGECKTYNTDIFNKIGRYIYGDDSFHDKYRIEKNKFEKNRNVA